MVNPGGESTMLGHWRIVLRQAEEAARVGRFEEAYALASRPDVADHHHAVQFRSRLALDLIARATRRGAVDDLAGAIEDLDLAERIGAPPDSLAAARLNLADRVAEEVRVDLDAGEPARALERIEELARHKIGGPALRRTREIAEAWQIGAGRRAARRVWPGAGAARPGRAAGRRCRVRSPPSRRWPRPRPSSRTARRGLPPRSRRCTRRSRKENGPRS